MPTRATTGKRWKSLHEIRKANESIGHHWFEPDTMRFFDSKIETGVIGGRYFVTSERPDPDTPRRYSVRMVQDDGSIDTVGEFRAHATFGDAERAARRMVNQ
jgi:hypothetical protein